MWFTGIKYYKLAVEKDRFLRPYGNTDLISVWKPYRLYQGRVTSNSHALSSFHPAGTV